MNGFSASLPGAEDRNVDRLRLPGSASGAIRPLKFADVPFAGIAAPEINPNVFAAGVLDPETAIKAQEISNVLKGSSHTSAFPQVKDFGMNNALTRGPPSGMAMPPPPPGALSSTLPFLHPHLIPQSQAVDRVASASTSKVIDQHSSEKQHLVVIQGDSDGWTSSEEEDNAQASGMKENVMQATTVETATSTPSQPINIELKRINRPLKKEEMATDVLPYCDNCESDPATIVCFECDEFYCDLCSKFVHLRQSRRRHKRESTKEYLLTHQTNKGNTLEDTTEGLTQNLEEKKESLKQSHRQGNEEDQSQSEAEFKKRKKRSKTSDNGEVSPNPQLQEPDDPYAAVQRKEARKQGKTSKEWQVVHGEIKEVTKKRKERRKKTDDSSAVIETSTETALPSTSVRKKKNKTQEDYQSMRTDNKQKYDDGQESYQKDMVSSKKKSERKERIRQRLPEEDRIPSSSSQLYPPPPPPPPPPRKSETQDTPIKREPNRKAQNGNSGSRFMDDVEDPEEDLFGGSGFFSSSVKNDDADDQQEQQQQQQQQRRKKREVVEVDSVRTDKSSSGLDLSKREDKVKQPSLLEALNKGAFANRTLGELASFGEDLGKSTMSRSSPTSSRPDNVESKKEVFVVVRGADGSVTKKVLSSEPKSNTVSLFGGEEEDTAGEDILDVTSSFNAKKASSKSKVPSVSLFNDESEEEETSSVLSQPKSNSSNLFAKQASTTRRVSSSLFADDDDEETGGLFG